MLRPWQKNYHRYHTLGSNYHIIMDKFFTSPNLLRILKARGVAATGTVRINCVENAPLRPIKEMEKLERGASDVVPDKNSYLTLVRWKDNNVVTVASTFFGKILLRKTNRCVKAKMAGLRLTSLKVFSYIIRV